MEPTLKELRAQVKEFRNKVAGCSVSKASADELKSELSFYQRAEKAEAARLQRIANLQKGLQSAAPVAVPEKKKLATPTVKPVAERVHRAKPKKNTTVSEDD